MVSVPRPIPIFTTKPKGVSGGKQPQSGRDVPRNASGRALIGDPRNDENLFVSQLQLLFLRFHNRVLDSLVGKREIEKRFEEAQKIVRHHYQYLVVHDFLRRVCHPEIFEFAVERYEAGKDPLIYGPTERGLPMPVEFSVAAYRFGHSMVRSRYAANGAYPDIDLFDEAFGTLGFSAVPPKLVVDWRFLLPVEPLCHPPVPSKKVDHLLADELIRLPDPVVGRRAPTNDRSLAFRNLLPGHVLSLPDGQSVAQASTEAGYTHIFPSFDPRLDEIDGFSELELAMRERLKKSTPLFFYILREAGLAGQDGGLGPVGSAILLEVFRGILAHCKTAYPKGFEPQKCIAPKTPRFELADVVRYVEGR